MLADNTDSLVAIILSGNRLPSTAGAPFDLDVQADDAIAVLDALGWSDAVVLGHSWGGYLLLHVLAAHPERVLAGVALEPTGAVGDGGVAEFDAELISRLPLEDVERLGEPGLDPDEMLALIWPGYFPRGAVVPPLIPGTVASMETLEAGQIAAEAAQPGLADRLSGLAVPVLFIVGGGSPIPATASTDTAAVIGGAASVVSIDGGHFPWLTGPGEVRAAVDAFLR